MRGSHLLAMDVGTSSVKCLVVDLEGRMAAESRRPWAPLQPSGGPDIAREFRPRQLLLLVERVVREAIAQAGLAAGDIAAVGVTSQRQGFVALDKKGREVFASPNLDLRAVFEGAALDEALGDAVYGTTGHFPSFFLAPARLQWLQAHKPATYRRISSVLPLADWLAFCLTGALAAEPSLACEAGLLDIQSGTWCTGLLRQMGLDIPTWPALKPAGTRIGDISPGVAEQLGLLPGTPVAVGGSDTQCGLLGMNVLSEGEVGLVAGWSAPLQQVASHPIFSTSKATWTGLHVVPGRYVVESTVGVAGHTYDWVLRDILRLRGSAAYETMEKRIGKIPPGSEGTTAFLGPSVMDMGRVGLRLGGFLLPVPTTHSNMEAGHLARAALENIAFAVRDNLDQVESTAGLQANRICVGGGMTRSEAFVHMLANVLGRELYVAPHPHVSGLGAAMAAAVACGAHSSLEEACRGMKGDLRCIEPDPGTCAEYQEHYERWLALWATMEAIPL
ncbi:MAG: FGGY-family carbohydrate kinase [Chloroflexi bacterium]|nr:FGGY-family carbohydrate kinase [Chloroflexota bacterium]